MDRAYPGAPFGNAVQTIFYKNLIVFYQKLIFLYVLNRFDTLISKIFFKKLKILF